MAYLTFFFTFTFIHESLLLSIFFLSPPISIHLLSPSRLVSSFVIDTPSPCLLVSLIRALYPLHHT